MRIRRCARIACPSAAEAHGRTWRNICRNAVMSFLIPAAISVCPTKSPGRRGHYREHLDKAPGRLDSRRDDGEYAIQPLRRENWPVIRAASASISAARSPSARGSPAGGAYGTFIVAPRLLDFDQFGVAVTPQSPLMTDRIRRRPRPALAASDSSIPV